MFDIFVFLLFQRMIWLIIFFCLPSNGRSLVFPRLSLLSSRFWLITRTKKLFKSTKTESRRLVPSLSSFLLWLNAYSFDYADWQNQSVIWVCFNQFFHYNHFFFLLHSVLASRSFYFSTLHIDRVLSNPKHHFWLGFMFPSGCFVVYRMFMVNAFFILSIPLHNSMAICIFYLAKSCL